MSKWERRGDGKIIKVQFDLQATEDTVPGLSTPTTVLLHPKEFGTQHHHTQVQFDGGSTSRYAYQDSEDQENQAPASGERHRNEEHPVIHGGWECWDNTADYLYALYH